MLQKLNSQGVQKASIGNPYKNISKPSSTIKSNPVNNTTGKQKPVTNTQSTPSKQQTIHSPSQNSPYRDTWYKTPHWQEKPDNSKPESTKGFYERNKFILWPIVAVIVVALLLIAIASTGKKPSSDSSSASSSSSSVEKTSSSSSSSSSSDESSSDDESSSSKKDKEIRKLFAGKIYSYKFSVSYDTVSLNGKDLNDTSDLESIDMRDDAPYYLVFSKDNDEVVVSENKVDAIKYQNSKTEFENAYKEQTKSGKQYYKVANHGLSVYLQNIVFVDDNHTNSDEVKFTQSGIDAVNSMINKPVEDGYVRTSSITVLNTNDYNWTVKQSLGPEAFDSTDTYSAYIKYDMYLSEFDPD